jgi:hypothetical protein
MISVSLIRNLEASSDFIKGPIKTLIISPEKKFPVISIDIIDSVLYIWVGEHYVWSEKLKGASSNFGIESCDHIFKIFSMITENDENWKRLCYLEYPNPHSIKFS